MHFSSYFASLFCRCRRRCHHHHHHDHQRLLIVRFSHLINRILKSYTKRTHQQSKKANNHIKFQNGKNWYLLMKCVRIRLVHGEFDFICIILCSIESNMVRALLHCVFGNLLEFPQHTHTMYICIILSSWQQKRNKLKEYIHINSEMIGIIKMILVDIEFTLCNHAISGLLVFLYSNPPIQCASIFLFL